MNITNQIFKGITAKIKFAVLAILFISIFSVQAVNAAHQPRISRRDTLRLVSPRRRAVQRRDERTQAPKNYRPNLGQRRWTRGRYVYHSHHNTTNRNFHTNSGRRAVQDRAGRLIINSNRSQMVRRRSTRHRW